jgi:hypothetical protein
MNPDELEQQGLLYAQLQLFTQALNVDVDIEQLRIEVEDLQVEKQMLALELANGEQQNRIEQLLVDILQELREIKSKL